MSNRLVIVTGLSGAGRSSALNVLEDLGYEAVDNVPLALLDGLLVQSSGRRPIALAIDPRTRGFSADAVLAKLDAFRAHPDISASVLYLDCADDVLQRRYTETRRRHPLAADRPVADGIARERALLERVRERADQVIDTTELTLADLRRLVGAGYTLEDAIGMGVFVTSFSFRKGVPREADLVFDVRFLSNPHYDPELRPLTGLDPEVGAAIEKDPDFATFFERLTALLEPLLPRYQREGKSYLTIAIGCTGGRHRSVFLTEKLGAWLRDKTGDVAVIHRDLQSSGSARP